MTDGELVPAGLVAALATDADTAIDNALTHGAPAFGLSPPRTKPAFVATFALGAVPAGQDVQGRRQPHLEFPGELAQLGLLSRWPKFRFKSSGYSPHDRDFSTCGHLGALTDCGRYGLIDASPTTSLWHQHLPATPFPAPTTTLGTFMAEMAGPPSPAWGRPALGTADHWSATVDELMIVTRTKTFSLKGALPGRVQRRLDALGLVATAASVAGLDASGGGSRKPTMGEGEAADDESISFAHVALDYDPDEPFPFSSYRGPGG